MENGKLLRKIRCSDIGSKCKRLLWFKSVGFDTPELNRRTVMQQRYMDVGSVMERLAVKWLVEEGYTVFYPERKRGGEAGEVDVCVKVGEGVVRGNVDLLIWMDGWVVGEVKTVGLDKLFVYKGKENLWDLAVSDVVLYKWLVQGAFYSMMLGGGSDVFGSEEGGWWTEFKVVPNKFYLVLVGREVPSVVLKEVQVSAARVQQVLQDVVEVFGVKELERVIFWGREQELCKRCAYDDVCLELERRYAVG